MLELNDEYAKRGDEGFTRGDENRMPTVRAPRKR